MLCGDCHWDGHLHRRGGHVRRIRAERFASFLSQVDQDHAEIVDSSFTGYNPSQGSVVQFHPFPILEAEEFYRFDLRAEHVPWLESGNGRSLRTPPAGPIGDRGILRQRKNKSPPSAANAKAVAS
jgi:hypothetical protein